MNELTALPNIGPTLSLLLEEIGVYSKTDLVGMGSFEAFSRIRKIWKGAGITMLYAVEGAILDVHYHALPETRRDELFKYWDKVLSEE